MSGYDPYNHTPASMTGSIVKADQWTPAELQWALKKYPMVIELKPNKVLSKAEIVNRALLKIGRGEH